MADADDPWANHVRGTPLAEGSDPLSSAVERRLDNKGQEAEQTSKHALSNDKTINGSPNAKLMSEDISEEVRSPDKHYVADQSSHAEDLVTSSSTRSDIEADAEALEEENDDDDDDDDEEFVYPVANPAIETSQNGIAPIDAQRSVPQPQNVANEQEEMLSRPTIDQLDDNVALPEAQPIDYVRLSQLCSQGPLSSLQSFFAATTSPAPSGSGVSAFVLANEPSPSSGLVPIQFAAREGKVDVLKWLINEAGALVEMEDREGETALHKAAMAGRLPALTFLIKSGASANCIDGDGWSPLHNACSKGYLDIVKVLIESAGASTDVKGGRGGWTPLMNAASNGHLPIVRYLTAKQHVDPFVRNGAGETAYDVAAATFEIFICEILEKYESERWAALKFANPASAATTGEHQNGAANDRVVLGQGPYNPLALHTTIPVVLHENQRLDTRLSTLAIRGGKPRWSGTQAGRPDKPDRRAPGTMPPGPLGLSRTRNLPMARDDINLPTRAQPYKLALPNRATQIAAARRARGEVGTNEEEGELLGTTPTPDSVLTAQQRSTSAEASRTESSEASHFWLSEWQTDLTHPQVDVDQGWQYSQSFDTPDERWLASTPAPLARLLEGRGLGASVQRAVSSVVLASTGAAPVSETEAVATGWVRRRRWVRVMRRRLDIEFGDALEALEQLSLEAREFVGADSGPSSIAAQLSSVVSQAQAQAREAALALGTSADYLARSRAMAGSDIGSTPADMAIEEMQKRIARIELAVSELRQHAFSDDVNVDRQQRAEELLKEYTLQLGQLRQAAGLDEESDEEEEDSDEEFIYPNSYKDGGQSVITRIGGPFATSSGVVPSRPSVANRQSSTPSVFGERAAPSEAGTSLGAIRSADLANAREFRVPTHETPSRPLIVNGGGGNTLRELNVMPVWESDDATTTCRGCNRRFTFFLRKHHCRRCGRIFCDSCSSHRAQLSPDELVIDPGVPEMMMLESHGPTRVCDGCDAERRLPSALRSVRGSDALFGAIDGTATTSNGEGEGDMMSDVSSRASELTECPVCNRTLTAIGDASVQEEHVRMCLENGGGGSVQGGRYLVYKLTEGPIVGKECQICLEDLLIGMTIARLPCLCYYHRHCIDSWFSRGRTCPVHARIW